MAGDKNLVFGATGPTGICLLHELVAKGDMTQRDALSAAVSKSRAIISLLGPSSVKQPKNTEFADLYRTIVPLMQEHGVYRILALGTTAMYQPDDRSSLSRAAMTTVIKVVAAGAYHKILAIKYFFEGIEDRSIEWAVFRVGNLSGMSEPSEWSADRINRSILARWLADVATSSPAKWSRQMPAVSKPSK
ncbi:hypothetical protein LCI18_009325 [Fusarium solani-melongenae]|uniref:Uncharacterized protein n=1 Tax=Fusarium solani subsp. cucurbitae TaxID=2747967 RepID=A0ACD3ZAX8_FUSSC|nr:hypothetical protein LCI18_009325 [Fusarium solani-melongenae]